MIPMSINIRPTSGETIGADGTPMYRGIVTPGGVDAYGRPIQGGSTQLPTTSHGPGTTTYPVDAHGRPVDSQGRVIDSQGRPVDTQGRAVDSQGHPVDAYGRPVDAYGRPIDTYRSTGTGVHDGRGDIPGHLGNPLSSNHMIFN